MNFPPKKQFMTKKTCLELIKYLIENVNLIENADDCNSIDSSLSKPTLETDKIIELLESQGTNLSGENKFNIGALIKKLSAVKISDRGRFLRKLREALGGETILAEYQDNLLRFLSSETVGEYKSFSTMHHDPKMAMVMFDLGNLGPVNAFSNVVADLYIKYFTLVF